MESQADTKVNQIFALLEAGWADRPAREIAQAVGCSRSLAQQIRRRWKDKSVDVRNRCTVCQMVDEPMNPVDERGICLWCRLERQGVNLREFYESGAWQSVIGEAALAR